MDFEIINKNMLLWHISSKYILCDPWHSNHYQLKQYSILAHQIPKLIVTTPPYQKTLKMSPMGDGPTKNTRNL